MYWLFLASELLRCPPWVLAEQPEFWQDKAFWFFNIRDKVTKARQKIAAHRNGETIEDEDSDDDNE